MASTYLTRTGTTGTANYKMTFSAWFKRGNIGGGQELFCIYQSNSNRLFLRNNGDTFEFQISGQANSTTRQFRDTSAWYHLVIAVDTTQTTASDRIKWYVNGEYISDGTSNIGQNTGLPHYTSGSNYYLGNGEYNNTPYTSYWDGSMSHVHFIDGTQYDATAFGQYDANGVWTIKTSPSVTYGTNGFFILKDGNSVTDQSGNGNNFTVAGGTLTNTEDNPSNVFATLNPLSTNSANGNWTNGNTGFNTGASAYRSSFSNIGGSSGKYYCEMKASGSDLAYSIGVLSLDMKSQTPNISYIGDGNCGTKAVGYLGSGNITVNGSETGGFSSYAPNDIIMIALDLDNGFVYFGKNGTWENSGDPTSGATGTGARSITVDTNEIWGFGCSVFGNTIYTNFGNGYFGTTAVASAGTNASGNGIFEYDVPTGYTALSTKGLNL